VWPCEPVRDVVEDIQSESMMSGRILACTIRAAAKAAGASGDGVRGSNRRTYAGCL
jgi:hypothetical protein